MKLKENQGDKAKVAIQEVDDDNTLLVMITEENYDMKKLLDSSSSSCQKLGSSVCSVENSIFYRNAFGAKRNGNRLKWNSR